MNTRWSQKKKARRFLQTLGIDSDFLNGRAVMKSPSVELVDRVLRLKTPAGQFEVDWRGKVREFSNP